MSDAVLIAPFDGDGPRGGDLVRDAKRAGYAWVDAGPIGDEDDDDGRAANARIRATISAARTERIGVVLTLENTRTADSLAALWESAGEELSERTVPNLRDRLLVVVPGERHGKRLRMAAPWAPSALDLAGRTGFRRHLAKLMPNIHRAQADCDDLIVPHALFPPQRLAALAQKLRTRGARLIVRAARQEDAARLGQAGVYGVVTTR